MLQKPHEIDPSDFVRTQHHLRNLGFVFNPAVRLLGYTQRILHCVHMGHYDKLQSELDRSDPVYRTLVDKDQLSESHIDDRVGHVLVDNVLVLASSGLGKEAQQKEAAGKSQAKEMLTTVLSKIREIAVANPAMVGRHVIDSEWEDMQLLVDARADTKKLSDLVHRYDKHHGAQDDGDGDANGDGLPVQLGVLGDFIMNGTVGAGLITHCRAIVGKSAGLIVATGLANNVEAAGENALLEQFGIEW